MPFTPYHLGPGAAIKAIGGSHFSFLVFAGSQVLMDIEPLVRILRGDAVLHGPSHTLLGAFVIALAAGASGRPISEVVLRMAGARNVTISWRVSFVSACIGTYSHVCLDAIMHADMNPFWPIAWGNPLLGAVSLAALGMRHFRHCRWRGNWAPKLEEKAIGPAVNQLFCCRRSWQPLECGPMDAETSSA